MKKSTFYYVLNLTLIGFLAQIFSVSYAQEINPENHQTIGDYTVHFSVFNSTFILPDIASAYKIKRSKNENLINISVTKKGEYGGLPASISGHVTNLMQQRKELAFITIKEKTVTYYLAPILVSGKEIVHFNIQVTPQGETAPLDVTFTKTIYAD